MEKARSSQSPPHTIITMYNMRYARILSHPRVGVRVLFILRVVRAFVLVRSGPRMMFGDSSSRDSSIHDSDSISISCTRFVASIRARIHSFVARHRSIDRSIDADARRVSVGRSDRIGSDHRRYHPCASDGRARRPSRPRRRGTDDGGRGAETATGTGTAERGSSWVVNRESVVGLLDPCRGGRSSSTGTTTGTGTSAGRDRGREVGVVVVATATVVVISGRARSMNRGTARAGGWANRRTTRRRSRRVRFLGKRWSSRTRRRSGTRGTYA